VFKGTQYYCRDGQTQAAGSPASDPGCITRDDVRTQLAAIPSLDVSTGPDPSVGVVYPPDAASEIAMGLWK
jgi:hypothetical protein